MASEIIRAVRDSHATRGLIYYDSFGVVVDVSAYAIELVVRHPVSLAVLFELAGTSLGTTGKYSFVLTPAHTCFVAGTYPGNIRFWSGGAPAAGTPPSDSKSCDFILEETVKTLP